MMKKTFFVSLLALVFFSCKKEERPATGYSSYYHISGTDTLSAVHVPNAFTPSRANGINDYFGPVLIDCDNASYHLQVFNGSNVVFQTGDVLSKWDGMYGGIQAKSNSYTWHITASDITGYQYDLYGEVHLLR